MSPNRSSLSATAALMALAMSAPRTPTPQFTFTFKSNDELHPGGRMRHCAVSVGTPGNSCGWRKRSGQKKLERRARLKSR